MVFDSLLIQARIASQILIDTLSNCGTKYFRQLKPEQGGPHPVRGNTHYLQALAATQLPDIKRLAEQRKWYSLKLSVTYFVCQRNMGSTSIR